MVNGLVKAMEAEGKPTDNVQVRLPNGAMKWLLASAPRQYISGSGTPLTPEVDHYLSDTPRGGAPIK